MSKKIQINKPNNSPLIREDVLVKKGRETKSQFKQNPQFLTEDELSKSRAFVETLPMQIQLVTNFLMDTGLRRTELAGLKVKDLDLQECTAIVKGTANRVVCFTKKCSLLIGNHIKENRLSANDYLFYQ